MVSIVNPKWDSQLKAAINVKSESNQSLAMVTIEPSGTHWFRVALMDVADEEIMGCLSTVGEI